MEHDIIFANEMDQTCGFICQYSFHFLADRYFAPIPLLKKYIQSAHQTRHREPCFHIQVTGLEHPSEITSDSSIFQPRFEPTLTEIFDVFFPVFLGIEPGLILGCKSFKLMNQWLVSFRTGYYHRLHKSDQLTGSDRLNCRSYRIDRH